MKTRVLYVTNDTGYFLSHRLPVAKAAQASGYEVHVAAPEGKAAGRVQAEGFSFHAIPLSRRGTRPWEEFGTLISLLRLYRTLNPSLVQPSTIKPVLYGGIAARMTRVPAVVHVVGGLGYVFKARGFKASLLRALIKPVYRLALRYPRVRVIFHNTDDLDTFVRYRFVNRAATALIRGSGVDMARFSPTPEPDGMPLVLLASRMLWDKGVGEYVEAARRLRADGIAARFVLVGDSDAGNPSAIPTVQLKTWHSKGFVEWWRWREDMPAVFAQAHLVCLPSYYEGVPKALVEAAACGRAIVATDIPGCREVVRHEENGLLVPVRDPRALAAALRRLIEAPSLRRQMGAQGRKIVEQELSDEKVAAETLKIYGELLA